MKIKKMTATFGALNGAVLELKDGLNIITAPNESGKSTWAGFLRAMLYGIDTRERDKAGSLADKNRYQPWSGAPMAGELEAQWQGKDITIRRFAAKNHPFGGFEAVYTATGDPVPGLTGENVGETLTGAGKEVFLRSAFIGEQAVAVSHSGELEARIAALATSGQEDVSATGVLRALKDWRNRRRSNRSNGLIPELEEELRGAEGALEEMERSLHQREGLSRRCRLLEEEERELTGELELWARLEKQELNRRYGEALEECARAEEAGRALTPPIPEFADWTVQEARDWAASARGQYEQSVKEREDALSRREGEAQKAKLPARLLMTAAIVLIVIGLALTVTGGLGLHTIDSTLCFIVILAGCGCFLVHNQHLRQTAARLEEIEIPQPYEEEDWEGQARQHEDYLEQRERLLLEASYARRRAEDLAAQGAVNYNTLEMLHTPHRSRRELEGRLDAVRLEADRCRRELSRLEGILSQMGDPVRQEEARNRAAEELARRTREYDALTAAMAEIEAADAALRQRFSPALNRAAGEIFSDLTGGRWPGLSLSRDFSARATGEGDVIPRSSLALSAGTVDQLYLAVRLALCELTLPHCPILLDDALAAFDDTRAEQTLDFLLRMGEERQILLFSCHSREARWAEKHSISTLTF